MSKQFIPVTYGLSQLEFAYGDLGYAAQLVKLSTLGVNLNGQSSLDIVMMSPQDTWNGNSSR